jgi:hypothetical protein
VYRDLARDGIAVVPASQLLGRDSLFDALVSAAARLEGDWAMRLEEVREAYRKKSVSSVQKPYSIHLLPEQLPGPNDIYTSFALQPTLLNVVNSYFGMYSNLTACNVWHNLVTGAAPSQSQLWHRDPEDRHILKVFVYLCDVDEGAGPFTYAKGSHRRPWEVAPHSRRDGETPRSEDSELARLIPRERWLTALGPKGTMILADTRGYHKGGWATQKERIVYTCEYLATRATGLSTRGLPQSGN